MLFLKCFPEELVSGEALTELRRLYMSFIQPLAFQNSHEVVFILLNQQTKHKAKTFGPNKKQGALFRC